MEECEDASSLSIETYLQHFTDFLVHFKSHKSGEDGTLPTPTILVPPNSYWTQAERNDFFHALPLYSRFRPDSIAAAIGSKNVLEVCSFIDLLDHEASKTSSGHTRIEFPAAYEVSEEFIQLEEQRANQIASTQVAPTTSDMDSDEEDDAISMVLGRLERSHLKILHRIIRDGSDHGHESAPSPSGLLNPDDSRDEEDKEKTHVVTRTQSFRPGLSALPISPPNNAPSCALEAIEMDVEKLSPQARRRHQKRLYMRRKRAEKVGLRADSRPTKLRVGRNRKLRKPSQGRPKVYRSAARSSAAVIYDSDEYLEDEGDGEQANGESLNRGVDEESSIQQYAHRRKGGKTKSQKAEQLLEQVGVDIEDLEERGLDLFNLSHVGKLLVNLRKERDSSVNSLSSDVLRLMKDILRQFIARIMRSSLLLRQQELRLKGNIKAWRILCPDEVLDDHVHKALCLSGYAHLLPPELLEDPRDQDIADDESRGSDLVSLEEGSVALLPMPLEFSQPIGRLPPTLWQILSDELSGLHEVTQQDDSDALDEELEDEEELDDEDEAKDKLHEEALRKELGFPDRQVPLSFTNANMQIQSNQSISHT